MVEKMGEPMAVCWEVRGVEKWVEKKDLSLADWMVHSTAEPWEIRLVGSKVGWTGL